MLKWKSYSHNLPLGSRIAAGVFEQMPGRVEIGPGLNLSPNALKSLRYLASQKQ
jgi:hypothetical protein